jgi:multidrug efflux pump subunit AcrB
MIENIDTHLALNKPLENAIVDAANQIFVPTFVATCCIVIVWLPLFGLTGVAGYLFKPMAEAVMFAMGASFILSRTLVPTMAKYMMAGHGHGAHGGGHGAHGAHGHSGHGGHGHGAHGAHAEPELALRQHGVRGESLTGFEEKEDELKEAIALETQHPLPKLNFLERFQRGFERQFDKFREGYKHILEAILVRRGTFVAGFLVIAVSSLGLFYFAGRDFFPEIRSGTLQMHVRAPIGTRIEASGRIASLVAKDIARLLPGQVENVVSNCGLPVGPHNLAFIPTPTIGSQDCDLTVTLRNESSPVWDYRKILRKGLKELYPGTEFTFQPSDLTAKILNFGTLAPLDIQIKGMDMDENYEFARKLLQKVKQIPGSSDVVIQQTMRTPTRLFEGNRMMGLNVALTEKDIADNLLMTTSGSQQIDQEYWLDQKTGLSYQVNVYTPQPFLTRTQDIMTVPVDSSLSDSDDDTPQLLGNVVNMTLKGTPGVVTHSGIQPAFDILVSAEGRDLGGILHDVEKVVEEMKSEMPRSAALNLIGQAETMHSAYSELLFGLVAAVVLVYLLIVVNFQSWLDPFIIITALPGALAGIAWSLFVTHTNISVPALTGAIMSMGTATANSILVVAAARESMEAHGDPIRAAVEAGFSRIRPVLMTASAMIIGMLPMAIGNSQNAPLGRAVMGGLAVATFATLFFVPCVYAILHGKRSVQREVSA